MKANDDKHIDQFIDRLMKETLLETPSHDFTANLMSKLPAPGMNKSTVYKPLISKKAWFVIIAAIAALTGYFIFNAGTQTSRWQVNLDFTSAGNNAFKSLSQIKFSEVTFYAVALLTAMLFVQIIYLKRYFDKRADV